MCLCTSKWKAKKWKDILKNNFYDKLVHEYDMKVTKGLTLGIRDFNGHVRKQMDGFESVYGENGIGQRNLEGRMLLKFCDQKDLCVANKV